MRYAIGILALASLTAAARADVVTIFSGRDNTLYQNATGAVSNGSGDSFFAGNTTQGFRRGLMFFKLDTNIPAGSTVTAVSLTLNVTRSNNTPTDYTLQRLQANWGEGTSNAGQPGGQGAPSTPNDATWIHTFFNTGFWGTAGGDFDPTISATTNINAFSGPFTWNSAQMVADVQGWVNSPAGNFGWIIRSDETTIRDAARFASRENADPLLRPALTITFTPVPEPTSLVLTGVAVAGGWLVRRRRSAGEPRASARG